MSLQERSAGVIVFREADGTREYLLLDYGRYWDYAKGHVEKGEDDESAALRELVEETGIDQVVLMPGFKEEMVYFFRSKRGLVRKSVCFFLGRVKSAKVTLSSEHVAFAWLPFDQAVERLGFASAKTVLRAAEGYLTRAA